MIDIEEMKVFKCNQTTNNNKINIGEEMSRA